MRAFAAVSGAGLPGRVTSSMSFSISSASFRSRRFSFRAPTIHERFGLRMCSWQTRPIEGPWQQSAGETAPAEGRSSGFFSPPRG